MRIKWPMRYYRTAPGYVGMSIGHSPLGWHIQIGHWVWTTEPLFNSAFEADLADVPNTTGGITHGCVVPSRVTPSVQLLLDRLAYIPGSPTDATTGRLVGLENTSVLCHHEWDTLSTSISDSSPSISIDHNKCSRCGEETWETWH